MPVHTPQQQAAITAQGDVLVMAGAGAGKTSTLVARILDRVLHGSPCVSLDRVLVVTFTEAAATEMRHRLSVALEAAAQPSAVEARAEAAAAWARDQRALLESARVSTLHAFCLRLVRDHFHHLDLDPQFAVQDVAQAGILRNQVLDEVLRAAYLDQTDAGADVGEFLRRHAADGDRAVRHLILRVHDYARTLPEPETWMAAQRGRHARNEPECWWAWIVDEVRAWRSGWAPVVARARQDDPENPMATCADAALQRVGDVLGAWSAARQGELAQALDAVARAGDATGMKRGRITEWRRPLKPLIEEATELQALVSPLPGTGSDPLVEDWDLARRDVLALLELVGRFTEAVAIARRAAAVVDFADLEQFALRLLWDPVGSTPTSLAREWRERLELVFVDEYQDINGAQDRIIDCVSREGAAANRFFVGDVKQSIYRFRRADPRIFQHYAAAWREGPHRRVIPLAENFRSHERILGFVNTWFEGLMRPSVGGVGYDAEARLVYGAAEARPSLREAPEGRVEIVLVPRSATDAEPGGEGVEEGAHTSDDLDQEESQAEVAAARLKEWHDTGLRVVDAAAGGTRPVAWRDMVVLHPSPRPVAERWARQFARRGVPLDARRSGFFEALEVSDLINLARILDNPVQDHALLAVLRSPLVGMTVDELAVVRWVDRKAPLWDALMRCARGGGAVGVGADVDSAWRGAWEGARVRASEFLEAYRRWRRLAREGALSLCLERALVETTFEAWLRAQPRAASRLANVKRLLALTRQFDQFRRHGLFRFLQFLDAQIQAEEEAESAPASVAGSVRLMSVHQSKGLEFPVVVVAGLGRRFNLADVREDWLLDPELGICPPVLSASGDRSHASVARWVAARRQRSELAGEQVRLLYVACTRAAERLVLLGDVSAKSLATWAEPGSETLGDRDVLAASSPIAWLGRRMPVLTGVDDWVIRGGGRGTWVDWRIVDARPAAPEQAEPRSCESPGAGISEDVLREVTARLQWHYPWPDALEEPGKVAVTTLSRKYATDDEASDWTPSSTWRAPATERSAASSTEAVERGAAHHLFCEWVDLERTATSAALADEVRRLAEEGVLSEEQVAMLDLPALAGFWVSPLGHQLREHSRFVERELPFTTRLGPQEFARLGGATAHGFGPEDFQVVQGVVDLAVILPGEIWIVDFKTDRVSGAALTERIQKYQLQLRLYAHALTSIYRRPVTQRWLWFFHPRELVAVAP